MKELKKYDRIKVVGNSIFEMMGLQEVTGSILVIHSSGCSFNCDQTGSVETLDFGDGTLTKEIVCAT